MKGFFHLAIRVWTFVFGIKGIVAAAAELVTTLGAVEVHAASSSQCVRELALRAVDAIFLKIHCEALRLVFWVIGSFPVLEILTAPPSVLFLPLPGRKKAVQGGSVPLSNYSHPVVPA